MQPPSYYPISMLPALTGRSLARCRELVEAGLVRSLEVPFGDKAKDDSGRRKARLVPAGRVRAITQIPEGEIATDPDEDEAERIARIASARADEVVRVRRMKDSSFAGFEVEVPVFGAIFPTERETLLMSFVRVHAPKDIRQRLADDALLSDEEVGAAAEFVAARAAETAGQARAILTSIMESYARRFGDATRDLGDPSAFLRAAMAATISASSSITRRKRHG